MRGQTVARASTLVLAGAALGLAINAARGSRGVRLGVPVHSVAEGGACAAPASAHGALPVSEAAALRGQAGVAFGDTRSADEYARGHVAGAWHLPCFGSAQVAASSLHHIAGARTLVLYGQDDAQSDARLAADELARRGFQDVRILQGGWRAWQATGLPAESGPCDECRKP